MKDGHRWFLIGLVAVALVSWLWAGSAFWQCRSLRTQLRQLRSQRAETEKFLKQARAQQKRYQQLTQELGNPLTEFDLGRMTAKLMEQVEGALTQSKLKAESLQPLLWQWNADLRAIRLAVQVTAVTTHPTISEGLQGVTELLMRLRAVRPPMAIERLTMQAVSEPRPALRLQAQIVWFVPVEDTLLKKWATPTRRPILRR
ncbi:MAG: hypothetical protein C4295_05750 [Candidatus Fervidibacterota bacterium]